MLANKLISKLKSKNKINKVRVSTNQVKAQYSTSESEKIDFLVRNYKILHEALSTSPEKAAQFANNIPSSENKKVADFLDRVSALAHKEKLFGEGAEAKELLRQINLYKQATKGSTAGKTPVKVAVTGASGQIGYALLFRIASGAMFGRNTPVQLNLLELPVAMNSLKGVIMELQDCAFPLLSKVEAFDDPNKAFVDIDYALLVGAKPRTKGMERADLLLGNAEIFSVQGKALNTVAKKTCKVAVVGNPANTNAMIAQRNAPSIPAENFTAMTRLDHNRGLAQLSLKTGAHVSDIENFAIWGNHSATQYPSIAHAFINGKPAAEVINDNNWVVNTFIPEVQQRGAAIIAARGASSAASAASSLIDHVHDWIHGSNGEWTSMGVISKGEYGVSEGLNYSYPVVTAAGEYSVVENLPIDSFSAERMEKTHQELKGERDAIAKLLPK